MFIKQWYYWDATRNVQRKVNRTRACGITKVYLLDIVSKRQSNMMARHRLIYPKAFSCIAKPLMPTWIVMRKWHSKTDVLVLSESKIYRQSIIQWQILVMIDTIYISFQATIWDRRLKCTRLKQYWTQTKRCASRGNHVWHTSDMISIIYMRIKKVWNTNCNKRKSEPLFTIEISFPIHIPWFQLSAVLGPVSI